MKASETRLIEGQNLTVLLQIGGPYIILYRYSLYCSPSSDNSHWPPHQHTPSGHPVTPSGAPMTMRILSLPFYTSSEPGTIPETHPESPGTRLHLIVPDCANQYARCIRCPTDANSSTPGVIHTPHVRILPGNVPRIPRGIDHAWPYEPASRMPLVLR